MLLAVAGRAWADPVTVEAQGQGLTREAAVSQALISAVAETTGVTVDSAQASATVAVGTTSKGTSKVDVVQATVDLLARQTSGRVLSYHVDNIGPAPEGGLLAHVSVQLEVFKAKGASMAGRRRVAVANFAVDAGGAAQGAALRDRLVLYLTQSQRFAVVDRSQDRAYEDEMAVVTGGDAAPAERARAGQVLGADYVVTGHLVVRGARTVGAAARTTQHTLELTGEVVSNTTPSTLRTIGGGASADFEVIEIATRQVTLAEHIDAGAGGLDGLAAKVTEHITASIYPPRLIDISDVGALAVNQGGVGMHVGQRFRVMQEGRELVDPYTHESLGRRESEIGVLEISEVGEKVSYGKLVSGAISGAAETLVLRPVAAAEAPVAVARAGERVRRRAVARTVMPVAAAPDAGLRLPFDH